jgi:hypothetical protein
LKVPKLAPVGVDKVVEVQFSVFGDEGTPTYALTKEYEGLSIDAAKGKVAVDLPLLWTKHLKGRARPGSPYLVAVPPPGQEPDPRAIFERLTGTPLEAGKVAFRLPLRVGVSNTAGESDELRLSMIVVAPKEDLDKVAVARQAELAAMQAKAQAEMQRRQQEQAKLAAERGIQTPGGSDADRIRELENRVRRMEITLDAVLLKLERMERSHSGSEKRETPSKQP